MQALSSLQNSNNDLKARVDDLKREVVKMISVSQEIALSCWLTIARQNVSYFSFHILSS